MRNYWLEYICMGFGYLVNELCWILLVNEWKCGKEWKGDKNDNIYLLNEK
jgi:hypothetical protein